MFLRRTAVVLTRRAAITPAARRTFAVSMARRDAPVPEKTPERKIQTLADVKSAADLFGVGAAPGTVPTDIEQSTGLERLEILGKMEDVDVFDMRPLDASRKGTLENPIMVRSAGDEQYLGCTGYPADSHEVKWITITRGRPVGRCKECGSVYMMEYVGPAEDAHGHHDDHHGFVEPKTLADYVRPEYF